jgi:hypothetical protein
MHRISLKRVTDWARRPGIGLVAEAGAAFLASAAFFVLAAAAIPLRHVLVVILLLGALYVYVPIWVAQRSGPLYGVPLAAAAGLALVRGLEESVARPPGDREEQISAPPPVRIEESGSRVG